MFYDDDEEENFRKSDNDYIRLKNQHNFNLPHQRKLSFEKSIIDDDRVKGKLSSDNCFIPEGLSDINGMSVINPDNPNIDNQSICGSIFDEFQFLRNESVISQKKLKHVASRKSKLDELALSNLKKKYNFQTERISDLNSEIDDCDVKKRGHNRIKSSYALGENSDMSKMPFNTNQPKIIKRCESNFDSSKLQKGLKKPPAIKKKLNNILDFDENIKVSLDERISIVSIEKNKTENKEDIVSQMDEISLEPLNDYDEESYKKKNSAENSMSIICSELDSLSTIKNTISKNIGSDSSVKTPQIKKNLRESLFKGQFIDKDILVNEFDLNFPLDNYPVKALLSDKNTINSNNLIETISQLKDEVEPIQKLDSKAHFKSFRSKSNLFDHQTENSKDSIKTNSLKKKRSFKTKSRFCNETKESLIRSKSDNQFALNLNGIQPLDLQEDNNTPRFTFRDLNTINQNTPITDVNRQEYDQEYNSFEKNKNFDSEDENPLNMISFRKQSGGNVIKSCLKESVSQDLVSLSNSSSNLDFNKVKKKDNFDQKENEDNQFDNLSNFKFSSYSENEND